MDKNATGRNYKKEDLLKPTRKSSWKRFDSMKGINCYDEESKLGKRKLAEIEFDDNATETLRRGEEVYLKMAVPEYAEERQWKDWKREPD
ncbi:hypothetical protein J1N35_022682 [Gossypium stocksii]|uniref:Uncharacterized protein n=1 Tax=Gossypium stocksii TaxID=47602 RepID=A0A9D3VHM8_9ROSI|nr:hypothetical protein J1N35_022682 [Gossypium stocksii]